MITILVLGYGDVVLSGRMRLLAPLQAANGLMMFGNLVPSVMHFVFCRKLQRPLYYRLGRALRDDP